MTLQAGRTLGHYEVLSSLGAGGMGEVYRARDTRLGREVAIKLLLDEVASDPERLARFEREARVLASLNHPHVATLHGFERDGATHFLVMELVEGETLADRIARGPMPLEEAIPIFVQIAEGLEAAHERGVIHRDLKPANVKVASHDGAQRVKILDFGLAKAVAEDGAQRDSGLSHSPTLTLGATARGQILGTAAYMSPEQARGLPADRRSDVWAFGVCLFEALTGRRIFGGEDASVSLAKVIQGEPPWEDLPAGTPPNVRRVLRRCLAKKPRERLHDIADARLELLDHSPGSRDATGGERTARERRSRWMAAVAGATVASLATWLLAVLLLGGPSERASSGASTGIVRSSLRLPAGVRINLNSRAPLEISRDGRRVVFSAIGPGGRGIYRRDVDDGETRFVAGTAGGEQPFLSPDGEWVGFFAGGRLKKVALSGGSAIDLAPWPNGGWGQSWGDGDRILLGRTDAGIHEVSAGGGEARPVTSIADDGSFMHAWPQQLDDEALLFGSSGRDGGVTYLPRAGGTRSVVVPGGMGGRYVSSGHLLFLSPGLGRGLFGTRLRPETGAVTGPPVSVLPDVYYSISDFGNATYSVSETGTLVYLRDRTQDSQLLWVGRDGSGEPVGVSAPGLSNPRLSLDGGRALTWSDQSASLWIVDLERGRASPLFENEAAGGEAAIWSPDGSITFASARSGDWDLYRINPGSSHGAERLLELVGYDAPKSWTPDGSTLVFQHFREANPDIWLWTPASGEAAPLFATNAREVDAVFSPDGALVAYVSDKSGSFEIYLTTFPPGAEIQLSTGGGREPRWSPDGRELFFRQDDRFLVAAVDSRDGLTVGNATTLFERPYYTRTIHYYGAHYDVAPDGERFLVVSDAAADEILMVQNWFRELERLLPHE